ncbi:hypothetical protein I79_021100 [Cricetulus griseus]|uniref:Uncharacterized protein n=1 Tax=Cricetulus griseus TaxID=10029 RepID=G3IBR5_CRIGR|nr:hypothetical protein I79_021100 [Cricetulus griseus]
MISKYRNEANTDYSKKEMKGQRQAGWRMYEYMGERRQRRLRGEKSGRGDNQPFWNYGQGEHRKRWSVAVMALLDSDLDMDPRVELHFQALILQEPPQRSSLLPMTFLCIFPRRLSRTPGHLNPQ